MFNPAFRLTIKPTQWAISLIALSLGLFLLGDTPALAQRRESNRSRQLPAGTQLKVRLEDPIDSKNLRDGERFQVTVLNPAQFADSTIEGHVIQVRQSGKFKGQTVLNLVFDRIQYSEGGSDSIRGQVVRVYGEKSVKEVDREGNLKGGSRGASTTKRTAGGAAGGAIIGAIIGGGKGAAIGAGVGAGAGAGSNAIRDADRIKLDAGTEMLIRTTR